METRAAIQGRTLEQVLGAYETIASDVFERARVSPLLEPLGVELMAVTFIAAKPTPEVGKALEAPYREQLLRKSDEATFARRAAAVEEERKIKENELNTEIALEQRRQALIELEAANALSEAESRGRALEKEAEYQARARAGELAVYREFEPRALLAMALEEMGRNAGKVGNLTITSEILASLLNVGGGGTAPVAGGE
jgi:regulator of protease activity HflC (stomatin/prohibitin superfamily)